MYDKLTRADIRKMEEEIEHRKLVVRKEALEEVKEARILNIKLLKKKKTEMKAASAI